DPEGRYRGGPSYYIEHGLGMKTYDWVFAVVTVVACGFLLPIVQLNTLASSMVRAFGIPPWVIAAGVPVCLGLILFGGVKRIAHFALVGVPFMAFGYLLVAVVVMALIPAGVVDMFVLIYENAFGVHAGFGALLGLAVEWGVKRGIYSKE